MQGILYEEPSIWQFFFVTCLLGGWAAWMTGRPARRPGGRCPASSSILLLLGIAVRFIHHALFDGTMFSLQYYIVDTIVLLVIGFVGYRYTRTNQMVTQYHWLYERASLAELEAERLTFIINADSAMNRRDKCLKIGKVRFLR